MNSESEGPEKLLDAISQRFSASLSVYANLARLTMLEARLFASGSIFIIIIGLIAALFSLVAWLLLLSIIVVVLVNNGVSIVAALISLLLLHLIVIGVIGIMIKRQLPTLGFIHVREALSRDVDSDSYKTDSNDQPN